MFILQVKRQKKWRVHHHDIAVYRLPHYVTSVDTIEQLTDRIRRLTTNDKKDCKFYDAGLHFDTRTVSARN